MDSPEMTRNKQLSDCVTASRCTIVYLSLGVDLPRSQTWRAQKMSTWLDSDVFIILGTYFTKLEGASCICVFDCRRKVRFSECSHVATIKSLTHFTIKLVLFLCDGDVVFERALHRERQVWVVRTSIGEQVEALPVQARIVT